MAVLYLLYATATNKLVFTPKFVMLLKCIYNSYRAESWILVAKSSNPSRRCEQDSNRLQIFSLTTLEPWDIEK